MQGRMKVQALEPDKYDRPGQGTAYRFETRGLSSRYKNALIAGSAKFPAGRDADEIDVQLVLKDNRWQGYDRQAVMLTPQGAGVTEGALRSWVETVLTDTVCSDAKATYA
jgi:hypothetical protein